MDNLIEDFRKKIKRKAIVLDIGGFRPPEDSMHSWFGKYCTEGESWPTENGEPMYALAQINVTQLPYRPKGLEDIDFIAIFLVQMNYRPMRVTATIGLADWQGRLVV